MFIILLACLFIQRSYAVESLLRNLQQTSALVETAKHIALVESFYTSCNKTVSCWKPFLTNHLQATPQAFTKKNQYEQAIYTQMRQQQYATAWNDLRETITNPLSASEAQKLQKQVIALIYSVGNHTKTMEQAVLAAGSIAQSSAEKALVKVQDSLTFLKKSAYQVGSYFSFEKLKKGDELAFIDAVAQKNSSVNNAIKNIQVKSYASGYELHPRDGKDQFVFTTSPESSMRRELAEHRAVIEREAIMDLYEQRMQFKKQIHDYKIELKDRSSMASKELSKILENSLVTLTELQYKQGEYQKGVKEYTGSAYQAACFGYEKATHELSLVQKQYDHDIASLLLKESSQSYADYSPKELFYEQKRLREETARLVHTAQAQTQILKENYCAESNITNRSLLSRLFYPITHAFSSKGSLADRQANAKNQLASVARQAVLVQKNLESGKRNDQLVTSLLAERTFSPGYKKELTELTKIAQSNEVYRQAVKKTIAEKGKYTEQHYTVSEKAQDLIVAMGYDIKCFESAAGNALQQYAHQEILKTIETTAHAEVITDIKKESMSLCVTAQKCNDLQKSLVALSLADMSSFLCASAKVVTQVAVGSAKGVVAGVVNSFKMISSSVNNCVEALLDDPLAAVQQKLARLNDCFTTVLKTYAEMAQVQYIDPKDEAALFAWREQTAHYGDAIDATVSCLKDRYKNSSLEDKVEAVAAFMTESLVIGKTCEVLLAGAVEYALEEKMLMSFATEIQAYTAEAAQDFLSAPSAQPGFVDVGRANYAVKAIKDEIALSSKILTAADIEIACANAENKIYSNLISSESANILKEINNKEVATYVGHIFSGDHVKNNIRAFGKNEFDIVAKCIEKIKEADLLGLLVEKDNVIETVINGIDATVKIYIEKGRMKSFNAFTGKSDRRSLNKFKL